MINWSAACLVIVDLQRGFSDPKWGVRNNFLLEKNVERLLGSFRAKAIPVIHVRHDSREADSPLRSGAEGFAFAKEAVPAWGEKVFTKRAHGAFVGTGLEAYLRWKNLRDPIFVGLTTDHCVSTSVRMAHDLGFHPKVVSDATATFNRRTPYGNKVEANIVHELALASLDHEFAEVLTSAQVEYQLSARGERGAIF
jgi:nicotinamidase-related amidase